jgi:hypothetical protein
VTRLVLQDMRPQVSLEGARRSRLGETLVRAVAVAAVAALGHDVAYTAAYGPGAEAARRASGHEPYWAWTWLAVLAGVVALVAVAAFTTVQLLRRLEPGARPRGIRLTPYLRELLRLWPRLALAALIVFTLQENVEHFVAHGGHVVGWQLFWSPEFVAVVPSFGLAALLVSAVAALFVSTITVLQEAVRRAGARPSRAPRSVRRPVGRDPRPLWRGTLAAPDLGRAPPA